VFEIESFKRNFTLASLAKTLDTFAHTDLTADVAKLRMPVLVLMGNSGHLGASTPNQKAALEAFTQHCPHAEVRLIDNGGGTYHMIEQPQQTAPVVIDFVRIHA
jgi:pimeloyl-ACP methyl ester carboxylesterase